ncbi:MAG: hypothetical protein ACRD5L_02240 [Bryobacteraceae bacterium]
MSQSQNPDRAELMQTIQRCAEAYHHAVADMPKDPNHWVRQEYLNKGFLAFCAHLPVLCDLAAIQTYIACIGQGAAIGAIDTMDSGRLCHIANVAMGAWKLANLTYPAAEAKERRAYNQERRAGEREFRAQLRMPTGLSSFGRPSSTASSASADTPHPHQGNHFDLEATLQALNQEVQALAMQQNEGKTTTPHPHEGNHLSDNDRPATSRSLPDIATQRQLFKELRARGVKIPSDGQLASQPITAKYYCDLAMNLRVSAGNGPAPEPAPDRQEQPAAAA